MAWCTNCGTVDSVVNGSHCPRCNSLCPDTRTEPDAAPEREWWKDLTPTNLMTAPVAKPSLVSASEPPAARQPIPRFRAPSDPATRTWLSATHAYNEALRHRRNILTAQQEALEAELASVDCMLRLLRVIDRRIVPADAALPSQAPASESSRSIARAMLAQPHSPRRVGDEHAVVTADEAAANASPEDSSIPRLRSWSRAWGACRRCNGVARRHAALGFCQTCYPRRAEVLDSDEAAS
jgi:hypothetical protein